MAIERVVEPSRIRRGRMATSPVWYVERDGKRVRFTRKKNAVRFEANGCAHADLARAGWCWTCGGTFESVALAGKAGR